MDTTRKKRFSSIERPTTGRRVTPSKPPTPKPPTKPKLSHEQIWNALEQIKKRDFNPDAGIAQFYKPVNSATKKNLLEEFEKAGDVTLSATLPVVETGEPLFSSTKLGGAAAAEEDVESARYQWLNEDVPNYKNFPWYLKSMDKLIVLYDNCMRDLIHLAEMQKDREFHTAFPQSEIVTTISKLDRVSTLMENFEKKSVLRRLQHFEIQSTSTAQVDKNWAQTAGMDTAGSVWCSVQDKDKFTSSMYKLNELIPKLTGLLEKIEDPNVQSQLSAKLATLKELADSKRNRLELLDVLQTVNKDVVDKAEDIELDILKAASPGNSSGSSSNDSPLSSPEMQ